MKPSKASIKAHLEKIREIIKGNRTATQANLIHLLNPVLRGWANYHRHVVSKKTFSWIDAQIWSMLWQWARRRHPNKGAKWVKSKYFKTRGSRRWVFTAKKECQEQKGIWLLFESDTLIRRHIKIKSQANPHDPKWMQYFNARGTKLSS